MRRLIGFLFILTLFAGAGLVVYAYVGDLTAQKRAVEAPAVGVGFGG